MKEVIYRINVTYNCNLACRWCYVYLDVATWPDSDITLEDIRIGGEMVRRSPLVATKVRISGGEPLTHPDFVEVYKAVRKEWCRDGEVPLRVSTNGTVPWPAGQKIKYRLSKPKKKHHEPWVISPADLGLETVRKPGWRCNMSKRCGLMFDCFGFSFCPMAGGLGRVFGIDPYGPRPTATVNPEICKHCLISLPARKCIELYADARNGKLKYPTKTYRDGFARLRDEPVEFRRFQERV